MNESPAMIIIVNGETVTAEKGTSIAGLLRQLNIRSRAIAVECNQEILPSTRFDQHILHPNDILEIVTLVGGG